MKDERKQGVFSGSWAKAALAAVMLLLAVQTSFAENYIYYSMPTTGSFSDPIWCLARYENCQPTEWSRYDEWCNVSVAPIINDDYDSVSIYCICNSNINFETFQFRKYKSYISVCSDCTLNASEGDGSVSRVDNSGIMNVSGGTLSIYQIINSGTLNLSGGTLRPLSGYDYDQLFIDIDNNGIVNLLGGTLSADYIMDKDGDTLGTLNISDGNHSIKSLYYIDKVNISGGIVSSEKFFLSGSTVNLSGGEIVVSSQFHVGTANINGSKITIPVAPSVFKISDGFFNSGEINSLYEEGQWTQCI